ncbi:hypothetical protein GCK32_013625 [Trichostrongylus colubriformis]|uniref:Uncharacterized protein n=1 Tax=Trichostrongylus colubriformis TaxID=6319 RepID=A0AAN8FDE9_TRICO
MEQFHKYEITRASKRLQNAIDNFDRALLEELKLDGNSEEVSSRVKARYKSLLTSHITLSRELDLSRRARVLAMENLSSLEDEGKSYALISDFQTRWTISGGEAAEDAINDLIIQLEVAVKLLPQDDVNISMSTPVHSHARTGVRPITSPHICTESCSQEDSLPEQEKQGVGINTSEEITQPAMGQTSPIDRPRIPFNSTLRGRTGTQDMVRFPNVDPPEFTGDIAEFGELCGVFDSTASNGLIPPTVKSHYFRSSLKNDALSLVAGYEIKDANHELAVNTLREAYFRPTYMRVQMSRRLEDYPKASSSTISQRITLAQIKSIWLQLKKLGEQDSNVFAMRIIRNKFPSRTLEHVGHLEAQDTTTWGVSQLLDALDSSIKIFEAIEDSAPRNLHLVRLVGDG